MDPVLHVFVAALCFSILCALRPNAQYSRYPPTQYSHFDDFFSLYGDADSPSARLLLMSGHYSHTCLVLCEGVWWGDLCHLAASEKGLRVVKSKGVDWLW